jgi:hypothetical protein
MEIEEKLNRLFDNNSQWKPVFRKTSIIKGQFEKIKRNNKTKINVKGTGIICKRFKKYKAKPNGYECIAEKTLLENIQHLCYTYVIIAELNTKSLYLSLTDAYKIINKIAKNKTPSKS